MGAFTSEQKQRLDEFTYRDIYSIPNAWNHMRYPVNARLEYALADAGNRRSKSEFRSTFNPRAGSDDDIQVNWDRFAEVYVPKAYIDFHQRPLDFLEPEYTEYLRAKRPLDIWQNRIVTGLFSMDNNRVLVGTVPLNEKSSPEREARRELSQKVYGPPAGRSPQEKIDFLVLDSAFRKNAMACAKALIAQCAKEIDNPLLKIQDIELETLLRGMIGLYCEEILGPILIAENF